MRKPIMKDRRKQPRYLAWLPIRVQRRVSGDQNPPSEGPPAANPVHPAANPVHEAFCIDISHGGIRLGTHELFHLHEDLLLTLCSPDGAPEITCEARVVRVARVPKHYEIAARITAVLSAEESVEAPPAASRK